MFVFKALDGLAPPSLSEISVVCVQNRALRSRCKPPGDRAFSVAVPKLWNKLPLIYVTEPGLFESELKTELFIIIYCKACW